MVRIFPSSDKPELKRLFTRRAQRMGRAESVVGPIIEAVRKRGDRALHHYTKELDGVKNKKIRIEHAELRQAARSLSDEYRKALETATRHIRKFAEAQMPRTWTRRVATGITLGQVVRPLDSVAAYVPGGRYPLPSTLTMTVVPAQVANVKVISVASPGLSPQTLGTAGTLGIENFFHMGGAQAIAAFAFGTETVPRAERIVGPGNVYVAAAKKLLAGEVGVDFIAGPTELVLISADGDPRLLAADMLAQAEHDVDASAILLTRSKRLAEAVALEIEEQLETLPTRAVASKSMAKNCAVVVTRTLDEAVEIANRFAPEHLMIPDESWLRKVQNAGSIFIGPWSAEAAGDYAAGPNHVLPTGGTAAVRGGLSVLDFVKIISVQQLDRQGLRRLTPSILTLARAEGLEGHARSIEMRFNSK